MLTILKHFLLTGIDGRKAIRRIAQPQPEELRSSGLGAAPQQAEKPFVLWKRNGWFFAFVLQVHCLPVLYQIGYKSSKQCLWRAICENPHFCESGNEGFLLVEALPQSPQDTIPYPGNAAKMQRLRDFSNLLWTLNVHLFRVLSPQEVRPLPESDPHLPWQFAENASRLWPFGNPHI